MLPLSRHLEYLTLRNNNIGYIGWLNKQNLGDEAMYVAVQRLFSEYKVLPFKISSRTKSFENIVRTRIFKACCLGGGTLINTEGEIPTVQLAMERYGRFFVFGSVVRNPEYWQNIHKETYLDKWVSILRDVPFVSVRGPVSRDILYSRGLTNVEVIGDPALFLSKTSLEQKQFSGCLGINFGVANGRLWGSEEGVRTYAIDLLKKLKSKYNKIIVLPVSTRDLQYLGDIVESAGLDSNRCIVRNFLCLDDVFNALEQCDLFIGEKLHSVVLAHCVHVPSIMLEYRPKCRDFMASMKMLDFNFRTDRLSVNETLSALEKLVANYDQYRRMIFENAIEYRRRIIHAKEKVLRLLEA